MLPTEETKIETPSDDNLTNEEAPLQITSTNSSPNKQEPQSLIAKHKDHSKRDAFISKCFNKFYDALTILISIADITTDIMVLISYYISGRMVFFWISFIILIAAQIGYLIVFLLSFDCDVFIDKVGKLLERICCGCKICYYLGECKCCYICCCDKNNNKHTKSVQCLSMVFIITLIIITCILIFCCALPFAHFVSFLMYFAENDESKFSKWLRKKVGIEKRTNIPLEEHMSEMAKFTVDKINKHGGFILEAFLEALPQSILQLVAMVYYEQTNYIAVGSIILSMMSIMTKSLVISQGIEWKSYLFCWLCVCTDFFSIFFVVSWVFLSHQHIDGEFLGHFNIIGQVWCWMVIIAIIPLIIFFVIAYFLVGIWFMTYHVWREFRYDKRWVQILMTILYLTIGNVLLTAAYCVGAFIGFLLLQILCFSFIAVFIWIFFTVDRWNYTDKKIANVISTILQFISNASYKNNDTMIRILSINYAYSSTDSLAQYIIQRKSDDTLHQVSYQDIRDNCNYPDRVIIFKKGIKFYFDAWKIWKTENWDSLNIHGQNVFHKLCQMLISLAALILAYSTLPIYLLSRIFTIIYPYFIVIYLSYYQLWFKMNLFQLIMLAMYILLQLIVFILGVSVLITHKYLWHITPGSHHWDMHWSADLNPFLDKLYKFYDSIQWLPITKDIVLQKFGTDIGNIIIDYIIAMEKIN